MSNTIANYKNKNSKQEHKIIHKEEIKHHFAVEPNNNKPRICQLARMLSTTIYTHHTIEEETIVLVFVYFSLSMK